MESFGCAHHLFELIAACLGQAAFSFLFSTPHCRWQHVYHRMFADVLSSHCVETRAMPGTMGRIGNPNLGHPTPGNA